MRFTKEATNAIVNFVNHEKELKDFELRLYDISVQYSLEFAFVQVDIDYVRELKNG